MDAFSFPEQASQARLAYWLGRFGFRPTVVERSPAARTGGQAVDVRGGAIDVVEAMGLYDQAHDLRTRMRGSSMLDADGNEIWRSEERSFTGGRFDTGVELNQTLANPDRREPIPDAVMERAKRGIELDDLHDAPRPSRHLVSQQ